MNSKEVPPQAPAEPASFDLGAKLAQRLREHIANRDRTQRRIDQEVSQLQLLSKAAPKRPRETKNALHQKTVRLERDRTSRSLPLAQEKALIRQIDAARKSMRLHDQADRHQQLVRRKKAEIEASRGALRTINVAISEIETALANVDLGKKLGCLPSEVVSREVGCPMDKLNWAIGKDGSNIKTIEESAGVEIYADKIRAKFTVRGRKVEVDEAVLQLEKFTKAVDGEVKASSDVIAYLLSQQSAVLNKIKGGNPDVIIDVLSKVSRIKLRGLPDKVNNAKDDIERVQIVAKSRLLNGKETSLVVGKTGDKIRLMTDKYRVVADLSKRDGDKTTLRVIGPSRNVDEAMVEVDRLLFENEEIEELIIVHPLLKSELLNKSGTNIKEFQRSVSNAIEAGHPEAGGVFLAFDRNGSKDGTRKLLLKCKRCVMGRVKSLVTKKLEEFESNVISINVPEEMIPAIIGKGGATINDLRKEGKGALVETDATNKGAIKVYSSDSTTRDAIQQKIEQIIAENQSATIPIEKNSIGFVLGDPGKDVRKACAEIGCTLNMNNDDTELVIKGTNEQIKQASEILKNFLAKNFVAELDIASDEQSLLFMGGSDSIMHQLEAKHHVKTSFRKTRNVLQFRGECVRVSAALHEAKCFLNGGDGVSVCKFRVDGKAKGIVIGAGGRNIAKLEDEFKGIRIHVPKENDAISIRGPESLVKQCRSRLITMIATTRVTESIDIDISRHKELSDSGVIKQISRFSNAQITLTETSVKFRGFSDDVNHVKINIEEHFTGVYHGYIDLEVSQFARVKSAVAKDPSHFQRIHASTGADVALESEAIHISGKKSHVKKAKASVISDFLSFMLPRQLQTVKLHRSLLKSMSDPGRLAQITNDTGASICLDRDISSVLIRCDVQNDCEKAVELVNSLMAECQKLIDAMQFDSSDAWLLPVIVGKGGSTIKNLEKDSKCAFDIYKDENTVVISADSQEAVQAGRKALENIIEQARRECIFIYLPESSMPAFIGKGGAAIKQFAADYDVQVERTKKRPSTIKITGNESCVARAQKAVLSWVKDWEASHIGITIDLEERFITSILGKGGETVRSIEKETGCKIDVNRQNSTLTVRYGNDAGHKSAIDRIQAIIYVEETRAAERAEAKAKLKQELAENAITETKNATKVNSSSPADGSLRDPVGLAPFKEKENGSSTAIHGNVHQYSSDASMNDGSSQGGKGVNIGFKATGEKTSYSNVAAISGSLEEGGSVAKQKEINGDPALNGSSQGGKGVNIGFKATGEKTSYSNVAAISGSLEEGGSVTKQREVYGDPALIIPPAGAELMIKKVNCGPYETNESGAKELEKNMEECNGFGFQYHNMTDFRETEKAKLVNTILTMQEEMEQERAESASKRKQMTESHQNEKAELIKTFQLQIDAKSTSIQTLASEIETLKSNHAATVLDMESSLQECNVSIQAIEKKYQESLKTESDMLENVREALRELKKEHGKVIEIMRGKDDELKGRKSAKEDLERQLKEMEQTLQDERNTWKLRDEQLKKELVGIEAERANLVLEHGQIIQTMQDELEKERTNFVSQRQNMTQLYQSEKEESVNTIQAMQDEMEKKRTDFALQQEQMKESFQSQLDAKSTTIQTLTSDMEALQSNHTSKVSEMENIIQQCKDETQAIENTHKVSLDTNSQLQQELDRLHSSTQTEQEELKATNDLLNKKSGELADALDGTKVQLAHTKEKLNNIEEECATVQLQLDVTKGQLAEKTEKMSAILVEYETLQKDYASLQQRWDGFIAFYDD